MEGTKYKRNNSSQGQKAIVLSRIPFLLREREKKKEEKNIPSNRSLFIVWLTKRKDSFLVRSIFFLLSLFVSRIRMHLLCVVRCMCVCMCCFVFCYRARLHPPWNNLKTKEHQADYLKKKIAQKGVQLTKTYAIRKEEKPIESYYISDSIKSFTIYLM